jgi:hypothetical protein
VITQKPACPAVEGAVRTGHESHHEGTTEDVALHATKAHSAASCSWRFLFVSLLNSILGQIVPDIASSFKLSLAAAVLLRFSFLLLTE